MIMAKNGMKRPEFEHKKNPVPPVPILEGKAKTGKVKANPLIAGADGKVYHVPSQAERTISSAFPAFDNDLAVENYANDFDMSTVDMEDLP
jgi:hypothetical protein